VVEHDYETIRASDWVIDLGPGAGHLGGEVVADGPPAKVAKAKNSHTGDYLSGRREISVPAQRRPGIGGAITIHGASGNNLHGVDASFPLGKLVCVTGVSGSGKSTLVNETLYFALSRALYNSDHVPAPHQSVSGLEHIDKVIDIDQSP